MRCTLLSFYIRLTAKGDRDLDEKDRGEKRGKGKGLKGVRIVHTMTRVLKRGQYTPLFVNSSESFAR